MNTGISAVSILIILSLFYFFMQQAVTAIRIKNKKIKGKMGVHVLGALTTLLVTVCVAFSTFEINYSSNFFIITTVILAVLFYIVLGWQTLFKIKR